MIYLKIWLLLGIFGMISSYFFNIKNFTKFNLFVNFLVFIIGISGGLITCIEIYYKKWKS